jgi:serine/threonine-protein kinase RsbW
MVTEPRPRCDFDADRVKLRLDVTISGDRTAIPGVVERIMLLVRETDCAAGSEFEVELAINEAIANAVVHGCRNDPRKQVRICVACEDEHGMLVVVRDPGTGFDPSTIPSPVMCERVFESHGRGIYLINSLMDEVRFERGGTEIWMRKKKA